MYFWSTTAIKELDFQFATALVHALIHSNLTVSPFDYSSLTFLYLIFHVTVILSLKYKYGYF